MKIKSHTQTKKEKKNMRMKADTETFIVKHK